MTTKFRQKYVKTEQVSDLDKVGRHFLHVRLGFGIGELKYAIRIFAESK